LIETTSLPSVNAALNACSALFLLAGYMFIRQRNIRAHRFCMVSAVCVSLLFLSSYMVYHLSVGSVRFTGQGWIRPVYFSILISHTVLATSLPVLAAVTLVRAMRKRFERHRAIARWTLPIWFYVSVTGVLVYVMLYEMTW
jgi:uncharacterized membrane protein YozB (DUF420 family)